MAKKRFCDIKEEHIAIHFTNQEQLEKLVDYLKVYGYDYGTVKNSSSDLDDIKQLTIRYFGKDNQYLSLDRSKKYHSNNFCSCGKGWQDALYDFGRIDWDINTKKEFLIEEHTEEIAQLEKELHELIDYDEWSAREYGETKVDYYWTAFNLLKAGYRKVAD